VPRAWAATDRTDDERLVRVVVRDGQRRVAREQYIEPRSLLGAGFCADSTYMRCVDMPTEGVHLEPGWDWRIELEPLVPNLWPGEAVRTGA